MLKKFIWIPASLIIGLVVWYFLKINIYDIKVPETPAIKYVWDGAWLLNGNGKVTVNGDYTDFLQVESDSIVWPAGVKQNEEKDTNNISLSWPKNTLPLQIAKVWIKGFSYAKVLRSMPANTADSVFPWDNNYDLFLEHVDPKSKEKRTELYKETFEENKIVLTLEKPNPIKIVALWQNYLITGETDGKSIKITVPRVATKVQESIVRVWICDSSHVSRVCEIPLHYGIIPTKLKRDPIKIASPMNDRIDLLYKLIEIHSGIKYDEINAIKLSKKLETLLNDENLLPVLAYGDIRALRLSETSTAILCNYFGKKILMVFNNRPIAADVKVPFKGELKKCLEGLNFNIKGATLQASIPANDYAIFY